jgi:hypothetical protein
MDPDDVMATLTDLLGVAVRKRHCDIIRQPPGCVLGLVSWTTGGSSTTPKSEKDVPGKELATRFD